MLMNKLKTDVVLNRDTMAAVLLDINYKLVLHGSKRACILRRKAEVDSQARSQKLDVVILESNIDFIPVVAPLETSRPPQ